MRKMLSAISYIGYLAEERVIVLCMIFTILSAVLLATHLSISSYVGCAIVVIVSGMLGCTAAGIISFSLSLFGMLAEDKL